MTDIWVQPSQLFDGHAITSQAICVRDGRIDAVGPAPAGAVPMRGLITPGFVDVQVNGGGGVLVNTTPTAAGIRAVAGAHARLGTVAIMPTVITDAPDVMAQAADAVIALKDDPRIIGLHIEGPHIALARRGTHAAMHVRPMENATLAVVQRLRTAGIPVMITLAPEAATSAQIAALAATGAIVSLGHTDTDVQGARAALNAGATCFTHLYNAMSPMLNRAPGVVGAAISSDAYAGIICDGIHVDDTMVGIALRARPVPDRTFLVSDAMPTVGGPDEFDLYGQRIQLRNGRLINEEGSLAGAHITQAAGVARLIARVGVPPVQALRMAITVPAALMDVPHLGQLIGRRLDDLLVLDDQFAVTGTVAQGIVARQAS